MKAFRVSSLVALAVAAALSGCAVTQDAAQSTMGSVKSVLGQEQVTRQEVGPQLYEVAYSASDDVVYVASAGGFDTNANPPKILKLDPKTLAVKGEFPLAAPAFGLALDDEAHRLYVADTRGPSVLVVDTTSGQTLATVPLEKKIREIVLDKANHRLLLPGMDYKGKSTLQVVDTDTLKLDKVVQGFGYGATGIALNEQAGKVYVSNLVGQLYEVDAATLAITNKFEVPVDQMLNVAFDSANGRVLAVDEGLDKLNEKRVREGFQYTPRSKGNQVAIIDPSNGQVTASVESGKQPIALLVDAERSRAYVSNRASGDVTVLDAKTGKVLKTVSLPTHPNSLALDKKTGTVYVTIKNGRDVSQDQKESVARIAF